MIWGLLAFLLIMGLIGGWEMGTYDHSHGLGWFDQ